MAADYDEELKDLIIKRNLTRNPVEKAKYTDMIDQLVKEHDEVTLDASEVLMQSDAPVRADHTTRRVLSRGDIANTGSTFRMLL